VVGPGVEWRCDREVSSFHFHFWEGSIYFVQVIPRTICRRQTSSLVGFAPSCVCPKPVRTVFVGRLLTVIAGRARLGEMRLLNILFDCAAVLCDTPAWRAIGAMETEAALVIVS